MEHSNDHAMRVIAIRRGLTGRVLVVDSQEDIGSLLAMAGYDTEVAGNAPDALRRLAQARCDLVISDLKIGLDGPGLYRQVVRRWPNEHPRFLLVSSSLDVSHYAQFLSLAHIPVLLKPFNVDHLREMVRRVLEAT
jgi:two-component system, NtrC family, response regulator HydG